MNISKKKYLKPRGLVHYQQPTHQPTPQQTKSSFRGSLSGPQAVGSLVGLPGGRDSTGLVNCRNINAVSVAGIGIETKKVLGGNEIRIAKYQQDTTK